MAQSGLVALPEELSPKPEDARSEFRLQRKPTRRFQEANKPRISKELPGTQRNTIDALENAHVQDSSADRTVNIDNSSNSHNSSAQATQNKYGQKEETHEINKLSI